MSENQKTYRKKNCGRLITFSLVLNLLFIIAVFILLFGKAETRQGINYKVHTYKIPLYIKVFGLFQRDYEYRKIANRIVGAETDEQEIAKKILNWTDKFIVGKYPKSFPIYDDHILNIIHRGYGTGDQRIDVATTLSTYAGVRAFWGYIFDDLKNRTMISYFKVNGAWRAFEPHEWSFFYTRSGEWATVKNLQKNREYIKINGQIPKIRNIPLSEFYKNIEIFEEPAFVRPEWQMPWRRLQYEIIKK